MPLEERDDIFDEPQQDNAEDAIDASDDASAEPQEVKLPDEPEAVPADSEVSEDDTSTIEEPELTPEAQERRAEALRTATHVQERTWLWQALGMIVLLVLVDYVLGLGGRFWLWSEQVVYVVSYVVRLVLLGSGVWLTRSRWFSVAHHDLLIVFGIIAGVSALILAVWRFIAETSLWTFLNLFVEPIDMVLLTLVVVYIISRLRTITKRS